MVETVLETAGREPHVADRELQGAGADRAGAVAGRHRGGRRAALRHRHRGIRPRAGRRPGGRRRGADRRRPRHRQVDPAAAGAGQPGARRAAPYT